MLQRFRLLAALAAGFTAACNAPEKSSNVALPNDPAASSSPAGETPPAGSGSSAQTGEGPPGPAAPPPPPPTLVVTTESVVVGGEPRAYVLAVPSTYDKAKTYPLVLALHGDGGDGAGTRAALPIDAVSGQSAIVAYPSGKGGWWDLHKAADQNADVAFLTSLVSELKTRFSIGSVFGTGFSSGAFMVSQLACRRPTLFRGIAPHAGGAPFEPSDPTASKWENDYTRCAAQVRGEGPAVIVFHGTADAVVTHDSGAFTATYWAYINTCSDKRTSPAPAPCVAHDACPAGRPVLMCSIPDLGHGIWSEAASATWAFFSGL
jgi:polyhydroxybutyrate depolymerase